jgi:hypothetical protein
MSALAALTAEELLATISDDPIVEKPFDLTAFKEAVLGELNRRMGDKDLVKDIPGTGLIQLAKELLKLADEAKQADATEGLSILDALDHVPIEHARSVLDREINRLRDELGLFEAKREELA